MSSESFSTKQTEKLIELYCEHSKVLESTSKTLEANRLRAAIWSKIKERLNEEENCDFSVFQVKNRWRNVRKLVKKYKNLREIEDELRLQIENTGNNSTSYLDDQQQDDDDQGNLTSNDQLEYFRKRVQHSPANDASIAGFAKKMRLNLEDDNQDHDNDNDMAKLRKEALSSQIEANKMMIKCCDMQMKASLALFGMCTSMEKMVEKVDHVIDRLLQRDDEPVVKLETE